MKCPKCKKGKLFFVPPPEGEMAGSWACDRVDCDYQRVVGGGTPEEEMAERDARRPKVGV